MAMLEEMASASSEDKMAAVTGEKQSPTGTRRKLIKPDFSLKLSISFDDDDDLDIPDSPTTEKEPVSLPAMYSGNEDNRSSDNRRHSLGNDQPVERPSTLFTSEQGSIEKEHNLYEFCKNYWACSQLHSRECLGLTLEEVVHIRNVLTKAELEAVVGNRDLYEKLVKGKICFICKNKEFGLVIQRAKRCKLCSHSICDTCSVKMRVPTENFAKIPVYMLSPSPSPPHDMDPSFQFFFKANSQKPASSANSMDSSMSDDVMFKSPKEHQEVKAIHRLMKWGSFNENNKKTMSPENPSAVVAKRDPLIDSYVDLKGPLACVCIDCKTLVRHIIETSHSKMSTMPTTPRLKESGSLSSVAVCLTSLSENASTLSN